MAQSPNLFSPCLTVAEVEAVLPGHTHVRAISTKTGQGEVHEVADASGNRLALKLFSPAQDPKRVIAEARALQSISHPSFVQVFDCNSVDIRGELCMFTVMELVEGIELADVLKQGQVLTNDATMSLLHSLSGALDVLWGHRIVHRDIKPGNILQETATKRFVLIDLAYARHLLLPSITGQGLVPGTPGYMSPEQAAGRRGLTVKADVFSLGIVAYQMRSGSHPFQMRQYQIGAYTPVPLSGAAAGVPALVSDLVQRMMDPNPLLRPMPAEIASITVTP